MTLLALVKTSLQLYSASSDDFVLELIEQAKSDLISAGIPAEYVVEDNQHVRTAIILFCKININTEKCDQSWVTQYAKVKNSLCNSTKWRGGMPVETV